MEPLNLTIMTLTRTFFTRKWVILTFLMLLFSYVFIVNAWVSDDAYITFRTVVNWADGYGPRWNVAERVQSYTHPLWMMIHTMAYKLIGNIYIVTILLSFIFSAGSVLLLLSGRDNRQAIIFTGLLLVTSKAFIDYTSSGLENPLSFFLASLFLFVVFRFQYKSDRKRLNVAFFLAALSYINRQDTVLLYAPVLLVLWYDYYRKTGKISIEIPILSLFPVWLWTIFSIIYYGFPFPNTYYAKLNLTNSSLEMIKQGFKYYKATLRGDFITLFTILLGLYAAFRSKNFRYKAVASGLALYLLYIIKIGGDFMSGRFFALPFFISGWILIDNYSARGRVFRYIWPTIVVFWFIIAPLSPVRQGSDYKASPLISTSNIADEKGIYYSKSALLSYTPGERFPLGNTVQDGLNLRNSDAKVGIEQGVGYYGFFAGPEKFIIDELALTDALLARMKVYCWRSGHCYRVIPEGYRESVKTRTNMIKDKELSSFYEKIRVVTMGDLFSPERFSRILELNFSNKSFDRMYPADLDYYKMKFEKEPGIKKMLKASQPSNDVLFHWVRPDLF